MSTATHGIVSTSNKSGMNATIKRDTSVVKTAEDIIKSRPKKDPTMKYIIDWKGGYRVVKQIGKGEKQEYFGTMDTAEEAKERRDKVLIMASQGYNSAQIKEFFNITKGNPDSDIAPSLATLIPNSNNQSFDLNRFMSLYEITKNSKNYLKEHKDIINSVIKKKIEADTLLKEVSNTPNSLLTIMEEIRHKDEFEAMKQKLKQMEKENLELKNEKAKA